MEEGQQTKLKRKWILIPIGLIATFLLAYTFLVLTAKPSYAYEFLKYAQFLSDEQQISSVLGSPTTYATTSWYRIEGSSSNLFEQIDKELIAKGWRPAGKVGASARWADKGKLAYLNPRGSHRGTEIGIWSFEIATPIHHCQVWLNNLFQKEDGPSFRP